MDYFTSEQVKNFAKTTLFLVSILALFAIGIYFSVFGPLSNFSLATKDSAWSNFGSYLGGVLGSVFSFCAFVGVLITVYLQAKQLENIQTQANLDETQRLISSISSQIDDLLSSSPNKNITNQKLSNAPITIFTVISAAGSAALSNDKDYIIQGSNEKLIAEAKNAIATESVAIGLELDQLAWTLEQYQNHGGSQIVIEFYKRRYRAIVCWLDALGALNNHNKIQSYFKPESIREHLKP
ncbi:MAG: hypothetical protein SFU55_10345 [Methylophilus sp.]|nr:hypothetical protein [Methylophilus sp.]